MNSSCGRTSFRARALRSACRLSLALAAAFAGGNAGAGLVAQPPQAGAEAAMVATLTQAIATEMQRCALPGLAIALADGDRVVWSAGFGVDDPARKQPVRAGSPFRVASISKLFTATAVLRAVEQGRLDLDADVGTWLARARPRGFAGVPLTLRHLLTHTGGVLREPSIGHYFDLAPPTLEAVVASLADTDLVAAPGTTFKYSNAAVACVGRVLEVCAARPFAAFMQDEILRPLGLPEATFVGDARRDVLQGVMWSYDGRAIPTPRVDLGLGPAANLCASMPELVRFAQSWFVGRHRQPHALLREETLRAMFAPQLQRAGMGLGFFVQEFAGKLQVGHEGAFYGVASAVSALPEEGLAVAIATTVDFASGPMERLVQLAHRCQLAQRAHEPMPAPVTLRPLSAARARALAGAYGAGEARVELLARGDESWLRPRAGP